MARYYRLEQSVLEVYVRNKFKFPDLHSHHPNYYATHSHGKSRSKSTLNDYSWANLQPYTAVCSGDMSTVSSLLIHVWANIQVQVNILCNARLSIVLPSMRDYFAESMWDGTRKRRPHTFTESSGYITQCSRTPAIAPAVIFVTTLVVGSCS